MPEPIALYLEVLARLWWVPAIIALAWLYVRLAERRTR